MDLKSSLKHFLTPGRHAYLLGIGGVGMSALARVLKYQGFTVSGSDIKGGVHLDQLSAEGIRVQIGQQAGDFTGVDFVIYSSAITSSNLQFLRARELGLPIFHRAEVLSAFLNRAATSVAVTGTHGKTTTSSMISFTLAQLGKQPTCLVGGDILNLGTNTILGNPDLWISEVDESDKTHELYSPNYAVITNLEEDHMENYLNRENLRNSFLKFMANLKDPGVLIYSADDPFLSQTVLESGKPKISFGLSPDADFSAQNIRQGPFGSIFDFYEAGFFVTEIRLSVPGMHNVMNALASLTVLVQLGINPDDAVAPLASFQGARRRLEIKWSSEHLMVVDDYAHHPTEVKASLKALRILGKRLTVVFQPHRFTRTRYFYKEFGTAFCDADEIILTDIYSAGESETDHTSVEMIYAEVIKQGHPQVRMLPKTQINTYLSERFQNGGVFAFLGAGDIGEIANEFTSRLKSFTALGSPAL